MSGNTISFMSANYVAREVGWAMHGWGHGDTATNDAFRPIGTFGERFDALLGDVRALGFDAIDIWGGHLNPEWATDEHLAIAHERLAAHDLRVASYQVYAGPAHVARACEITVALGTRVLSGFVPVAEPATRELLGRHDLVFGLENHPEPTPQVMLEKIGDDPRLGVCVDTGWFGTQGYDAPQAIEELGDRIVHVHLKDVLALGEPHDTCRWGEGIVDIEGCVRALQRVGYGGAISVEHEPETFDPSEDVRAMRAELEGWLR
jgi:sugar phosphate isomerase/epimerase